MNHILRCHPIVKSDFVRGEGCHLIDAAGRRYVDFESGIWAAALGHNHERINAAACAQVHEIVHLGTRYPSPLAEDAADALLQSLGWLDGKCVFLSSGSEAVELAVSIARNATGRDLAVTFTDSYLAAYGSLGTKADRCLTIDWLSCRSCAAGACDHLAAIDFARVAAFVFEPGSSSGAVRFAPASLVGRLARSVREAGGLLVANEVTTGLGRTGEWFGFDHYGLHPELVALGKALGNGFPVSAVAMAPAVATAVESNGFRYAQSHQNDPFGCAIAREVIHTMRDEDIVARARRVGDSFRHRLDEASRQWDAVSDVRGRGLMVAIELGPDVQAEAVSLQLLDRGFIVGVQTAANVLRFQPPLIVDEPEIEALLQTLDGILLDSPATLSRH